MTDSSPRPGEEQTHDSALPSRDTRPDSDQNGDTSEDESATAKTPSSGADRPIGEDRAGDKEEETSSGLAARKDSADDEQEDDEDDDDDDDDEEEEEEEDDEEEDDEPKLKYARLTQHLIPVYRNGDATSMFLVAGDKMIIGSHNGNIHVVQLPIFQSLRVYHAHSASVTGISISPFPPPLPTEKPENPQRTAVQSSSASGRPSSRQSDASFAPTAVSRKSREPQQVPKTPSNDIYIATASMDGNVCVQSLVDMRDVQLRNFARPLQAVALSPDYRNDRTYLTGGLAGQLILTVGGGPGRSTATTIGTAAATASGWLGSMGLGSNTGKDTILHSGEGTINTIKWSLSGKFVVWLNEHGIKIMRTNLHLDSSGSEDAWKRIGHIDRPQTDEWETMASVWKGRVEWIDEQAFETNTSEAGLSSSGPVAAQKQQDQAYLAKKNIERLLVGWGGTIWIIHVHPAGIGTGKNVGEKTTGRAEIVKMLRVDCIISGISLYTPNLLLVLAYSTSEDEDDDDHDTKAIKGHKSKLSTASAGSEPSGGIKRRQNHQRPELRLIDLDTQEEVDSDSLSVSRYERLSAADYHLGILPARNAASAVTSSRGALEALAGIGTDMWHAAINPKSLFSSGASIKSRDSGDETSSTKTGDTMRPGKGTTVHPNLVKPGAKIFIHSPYDCILATKRDLGDHLAWLLERQQYRQAWELLDKNPGILTPGPEKPELGITSPSRNQGSTDELYDDESIADSNYKSMYSSVEKEKRRIGELWIGELVDQGKWREAGVVCGRVLTTPDRWEKWVWAFAGANRFDEITYQIPSEPMIPPVPNTIYEVVLGHYLQTDKLRFRELLDRWTTDLFDIKAIATALENQLKFRDVREDSVEDGEKGRDWRIVMESLARLHEANGRHREALKCYIKLQDADSAFRLIRDSHLAESVADDIPGFIGLRVSPDQNQLVQMTEKDLEVATSEAITLLVDEAQHGLVQPKVVVEQLLAQELNLYLYFYLRGLWRGEGILEHMGENIDRLVQDSQSLVDNFADLAVHLFATYNRELLMEFLKASTSYGLEKAVQECERFSYYDELVYLYSKTGQMKRALYLIIDRLKNVHKAIEFAKEQDDPDLWDDLLNYSMDKPSFIRGLLEHAGTAIDPIKLVRRIPEGLEIPGLREGLTHMMKEHEIQYSIGSGAARVIQSEVAAAQKELRTRQRKAVKFEVVVQSKDHVDVAVKDVPSDPKSPVRNSSHADDENVSREPQPGHCAKCHEPFTEEETETLLGYACGHVYHLHHLLELLHKGKKIDVDFGGSMEESGRYSVGMKVMRARLLRDKVRGGCPVCHSKSS